MPVIIILILRLLLKLCDFCLEFFTFPAYLFFAVEKKKIAKNAFPYLGIGQLLANIY